MTDLVSVIPLAFPAVNPGSDYTMTLIWIAGGVMLGGMLGGMLNDCETMKF